MNIKKRMQESKCDWLDSFLKKKLEQRDIKSYNRAKRIIYYFPTIIDSVREDEFETAIKYPKETYICLGKEDARIPQFDNLYKKIHNEKFNPSDWGETRYLTIEEICEHFNI